MMEIRKATERDVEALVDLAVRTFCETFAAVNRAEDVALYLERTYGIDRQTAELNNPQMTTLIAEDEGRPIAFAQLRKGWRPDGSPERTAVELMRFYVDHPWHGRGVARQLMTRVVAEARGDGAETLWLGVWERNGRAIAFYQKLGFVDIGSHIFVFGSDPQTDRIMSLRLGE